MLGAPPKRDHHIDFRQAERYPVFDVMRIVAGLMVVFIYSFAAAVRV